MEADCAELRAVFDAIDDFLIVFDAAGHILDVNSAVTARLGYARDELIGQSILVLFPQERPEDASKRVSAIVAGKSGAYLLSLLTKERQPIPVETKISRTRWRDQEVLIGISREISQRNQAEADLRESEERFRVSFANASVGFVITDPEGRFVDANPAFCAIVGYAPDELRSLRFPQLVHPDDRPANLALNERMIAGEIADFVVENRYIRKNGDSIWVRKSVSLVRGADRSARWLTALVENITERKQAEAALRNSEERMKLAFRATQDGIWDWNMETNEVFYSTRWKAMLGYAEEEIEPHASAWTRLLHPDDRARATEVVAGVMRGQRDYVMEFRMRHKDGHYVEILSRGFPVRREPDGPVVRIVGTHFDLTERKLLEDRLRQLNAELEDRVRERTSELLVSNASLTAEIAERKQAEDALVSAKTFLDLVVDMSPFAMWVSDRAGTIIRTNRSLRETINLSDDVILGRYNVFNDENLTAQGVMPLVRAVYERREPTRFSIPWSAAQTGDIAFRNGRDMYIDVSMFPIVDAQGKLTNVVCQWIDITDRKQAERKLIESEKRLALVTEGSQMGYWDWNIATGDVKRNARWAEMLGYTLSEIEADVRQWSDFLHPDDQHAAWQSINDHLEGRTPAHRCEYRMRCKNGEYRWILDQARVVERDADGQPLRMSGTHIDITERKKAEEALQQSKRFLEETLLELRETQEQMLHQERLAAVGQLAAGIAHDFNNILTGILFLAELLQMAPDTPETMKSRLATIIAQGQRAAHMVRQLLDFSRKTIRRPKLIELDALLNESAAFFGRAIPENIEIALSIAPGAYLIEADPTQLQQVIINLAVNARDAMPEGGKLAISLAPLEAAGDERCAICGRPIAGKWLALTIADTGSGIAAEVLPHILEPFFTTKEIGEGTGLGLAQVAGIMEQHNGHLSVSSRVKQGTTFTVYLPPAARQADRTPEEAPPTLLQGHGQTVLLVEDEPAVVDTVQAVLEHLHYRVITAANGRDALAEFRAHRGEIDLVLSDMVMPDMDGAALFQALKAEAPELRMVLMSGYPLGDKGAELLAQGVVAWLDKPVSFGQLSQVVGKALSKRIGRWQ